jgi:hypothetical protein
MDQEIETTPSEKPVLSIWFLKNKEGRTDEVDYQIVRARDVQEARKLASLKGGSQWLSRKFATCFQLPSTGKPRVLVIEYPEDLGYG